MLTDGRKNKKNNSRINKIIGVSLATITVTGFTGGLIYELNGAHDSNVQVKSPTVHGDNENGGKNKVKSNNSITPTATIKEQNFPKIEKINTYPKKVEGKKSNTNKPKIINTGSAKATKGSTKNAHSEVKKTIKTHRLVNHQHKIAHKQLHSVVQSKPKSSIAPKMVISPTSGSNPYSKKVDSTINNNSKSSSPTTTVPSSSITSPISHSINNDSTKSWNVTGSYDGKDIAQTLALAEKYSNGTIPVNLLCSFKNIQLRCDAAAQLDALNQAYHQKFGVDLNLVQGYRSYIDQVSIKNQWTAKGSPGMAAAPGTSNHGWGLAVDFGSPNNILSSPQHQWLVTNAPTYGWNWPLHMRPEGKGPHEAWHFEFNGPGLTDMDK